jgi:hypothetical protein
MLHGLATGTDRYVGALLHRTREGRVARPQKTSGWYWEHEVVAAKAAGCVDTFDVDEWVQYDPCDCPPPFAEIANLYQERLEVGKDSSHGKAYKLIYNSSYGKMAQSVGNPVFSNPIYASLITTGCRTQILNAIATHPQKTNGVLMVATDGVYFKTKHPSLHVDKSELGAWGMKEKRNLTLFIPGVYWDDESRKRVKAGKEPELKSRGIARKDLADNIEALDEQFRNIGYGHEWPTLTIPINFNMVSPVQALQWGKWYKCGLVRLDTVKKINSDPVTKRGSVMWPDPEDPRITESIPYPEMYQLESTPYDKHFGEELNVFMELDSVITPDGTLRIDLVKLLNGD